MNHLRRIWQRLSKREKGLVAVTLVIFGLLLGRAFVLTPFLERQRWVQDQLELQPGRLEKNLRYIAREAAIMAALEKARAQLKSLEPLLLTGDTPSVSASSLQETVQGFAKGGVQIVSTRVLNPEAMGTFTRIPIQLEISGLIEQVAGLIEGIEKAPKLLAINEINIRSFAVAGPPRRPGAEGPVPPQNLRVSLTVSGFIRSQPPSPAKEAAPPAGTKAQPGKPSEEALRRPRDFEE